MRVVCCLSQRANFDGQARKAYNLIWNFKDLIHPQVRETPVPAL